MKNMTAQLDAVTRRLQGRHLATIDNVVGVPGKAPAIVITWSDEVVATEYVYDNLSEYLSACEAARSLAQKYFVTHVYDIVDNTL